jgi:hypothetical protein
VHEINIFAFVLVVQSLPFLAAIVLAAIEGTRFNNFAYWRGIEARVAAGIAAKIETTIGTKAADLLPQREAMSNAMTNAVTNAVSNVMTSAVAEAPKVAADTAEPAQ